MASYNEGEPKNSEGIPALDNLEPLSFLCRRLFKHSCEIA